MTTAGNGSCARSTCSIASCTADIGGSASPFTWELGPDGADAVVVGFDVAQWDADGRLALVLGFLDRVPSP
jgi:hypothetical protein